MCNNEIMNLNNVENHKNAIASLPIAIFLGFVFSSYLRYLPLYFGFMPSNKQFNCQAAVNDSIYSVTFSILRIQNVEFL